LILSPTRELAIQIQDSAKVLLSGTPYTCDHVVGGTNMKSEINRLNKQQTGSFRFFLYFF
jgi:ATP-dependent RNA helicase MSS116